MPLDNMPINAAAEAELNKETDSYVTPPNATDGPDSTGMDITAIADPNAVVDDTVDVSALVQDLETAQTEIATTENNVTRLHDLQDVANTVLTQESIGQSDVETIERKVGGFIGQEANLNEFTQVPSRVGLSQVRGFITGKVEEQKATTEEQFLAFITNTRDKAAKLLAYVDEYVPQTVRTLDLLREQATCDIARAAKCSRFWMYYLDEKTGEATGEAIDMRYEDLRHFSGRDKLGPLEILKAEIYHLFSLLQNSDTWVRLERSSTACIAPSAIAFTRQPMSEDKTRETKKTMPTSYMAILETLAGGRYMRILELCLHELTTAAEAAVRFLDPEVIKSDSEKFEAISSATACISTYYQNLTGLIAITGAAAEFAAAVTPILTAFGEVLDREAA